MGTVKLCDQPHTSVGPDFNHVHRQEGQGTAEGLLDHPRLPLTWNVAEKAVFVEVPVDFSLFSFIMLIRPPVIPMAETEQVNLQ